MSSINKMQLNNYSIMYELMRFDMRPTVAQAMFGIPISAARQVYHEVMGKSPKTGRVHIHFATMGGLRKDLILSLNNFALVYLELENKKHRCLRQINPEIFLKAFTACNLIFSENVKGFDINLAWTLLQNLKQKDNAEIRKCYKCGNRFIYSTKSARFLNCPLCK